MTGPESSAAKCCYRSTIVLDFTERVTFRRCPVHGDTEHIYQPPWLDPNQLEMIAVALLDPKAYPKLREQMAADVRRWAARVEVGRG